MKYVILTRVGTFSTTRRYMERKSRSLGRKDTWVKAVNYQMLLLDLEGGKPALICERWPSNDACKRICPGRYFLNQSLFIAVASVLHVFKISKPASLGTADPKPEQYKWSSGVAM